MPSQSPNQPTLDEAVQSFKQWAQGGEGMDELDFKEYLIDVWLPSAPYVDKKVREARIDEWRLITETLHAGFIAAEMHVHDIETSRYNELRESKEKS